MAKKSRRKEIAKERKIMNNFFLMISCFVWFIIWNIMNFVSLYWTSKWWISTRSLVNLIIWPWLWGYIWNLINNRKNYVENKNKKPKKKRVLHTIKWVTIIWYIAIIVILLILASLTINNWFEKNNCEVEKETINYLSCIDETRHNILNISRIFHD